MSRLSCVLAGRRTREVSPSPPWVGIWARPLASSPHSTVVQSAAGSGPGAPGHCAGRSLHSPTFQSNPGPRSCPEAWETAQERTSANPETAESRRPTRGGRGCLLTSARGTCPTFCLRLVSRKTKTEIISCHRTRAEGSPADGPGEEGAGPRTGSGKGICAQRTAHALKGRPERRHGRCSRRTQGAGAGQGTRPSAGYTAVTHRCRDPSDVTGGGGDFFAGGWYLPK